MRHNSQQSQLSFANPTDSVLTVPVPVEVEPGLVEVQVVTAAGVETNRVEIDVTD
ncbi:hypothetical protein [Streptomyces atratus]|uniref:hypothetical protein n=1 Tax=Streptomyces atratus TaxID=1893 RepID=UPI003668EE03